MNHACHKILLAAALCSGAFAPCTIFAKELNHPAGTQILSKRTAFQNEYIVLESGSYTQFAEMEFVNTTLYIKGTVILDELSMRNVNLIGLDSNAHLVILDEFDNEGKNTISNLNITCNHKTSKELLTIKDAKAVSMEVYGQSIALGSPASEIIHVKLDANGGEFAKGNTSRRSVIGVNGQAAISLPAAYKQGSVFLGWSKNPRSKDNLVFGPVFTTNKDTTLYAMYGTADEAASYHAKASAAGKTGNVSSNTGTQSNTGNNSSSSTAGSSSTSNTSTSGKGNGTGASNSTASGYNAFTPYGVEGTQVAASSSAGANGKNGSGSSQTTPKAGANSVTNSAAADQKGSEDLEASANHSGAGRSAAVPNDVLDDTINHPAQNNAEGVTTAANVQVQTIESGNWVTNADGSSSYQLPDGTYVKNTLAKIGKNTYYFDENGKMAQNDFAVIDGKTYFFDNAGHMKTGWMKKPGTNDWCFFAEDGHMVTGWITDHGSRYYLNEDGTMAASTFVHDHGKTYYVDNAGAMKTGWLKKDNNWYFFGKDGVMAQNETVDGFQFDAKGICLNP